MGYIYENGKFIICFYSTSNSGKDWKAQKILPSENGYGYCIVQDPQKPKTLYIGGYIEPNGVFLVSKNQGKTWKKIGGTAFNSYRRIYAAAVDPQNSKRLYACCYYYGAYSSTDSGKSWTRMTSNYAKCIKINPKNPKEIYIAGEDGVFCSHDYGATWKGYNNGLIIPDVNCIDMNTKTNEIFVGTNFGSIFRNKLMPGSKKD